MKIESLIVEYLFANKEVTLQGIGTFRIEGAIPTPSPDKPIEIPEDAVSFIQNKQAPLDEGLIDYIVKETRKIKPLATSDLESFSLLSKEYLNIGKPLLLEGLGTLQIDQHGSFFFTPGIYVHPKLELTHELKEKEQNLLNYQTPPSSPNKKKDKALIWGLIVLVGVLAVAGFIYYNYVLKDDETNYTEITSTPPIHDSLPVQDSIIVREVVDDVPKDTVKYLVIKQYNDSTRAMQEVNRLTSYQHKVEQRKADTNKYLVVMAFPGDIADTTAIKDSINRFFGVQSYFLNQ